MNFTEYREAALLRAWNCGAIAIEPGPGATYKIHERLPADAPSAPVRHNLRPAALNGPLDKEGLNAIARSMLQLARMKGLLTNRYVAGIPAAGEPVLAEFLDNIIFDAGDEELTRQQRTAACREWHALHTFKLAKIVTDAGRRVVLNPTEVGRGKDWKCVLLIDDLVNWGAMSKLEPIQEIVRNKGRVTDVLVFMDYGHNTTEALAKNGVSLHSVWKFDNALEWLFGRTSMTRKTFEDVDRRVREFYDYVQQHV